MPALQRHDWRNLPRAVYNGEHDKKKIRYSDPTFFNKASVKTGTAFTHYNRLTETTTWVVECIWTITGTGRDRVRSRIAEVRTMNDRVEMRCEETGERRTHICESLVYSALWRLTRESS